MSSNGDIDDPSSLPDLLDLDYESDDKEIGSGLKSKNALNDDESSILSEDDIYINNELAPSYDNHGETGSISSVGSRSMRQRRFLAAASILKHVTLRAVSSHLQKADVGTPTAMCVGNLIIIGTSQGVIMCFDGDQNLIWSRDAEKELGSVTSLALNAECTRTLVGFARGVILMLDSQENKILRTIPVEAHAYLTAVIHIKFTDSPGLAVLCDSGGSVYEIGLKRVLGKRTWDSKVIFSGSKGEVVAIEPLILHNLQFHPLYGSVIIAMATLSKVLLLSLKPQVRLLFTQTLKAIPTTLPLLSWQFVVIQVADTSRVMDPVLAVARNNTIFFYQVSLERSGKISCRGLQSVSLPYSLISCQWLTTRTVALIDTNETLHLLDVRTKQELECLDLSMVEIVYNSAAFKGVATGGNVSKAMALAGQRAVYNSILGFGNQLLLLGLKSLHVISIRLWTERIDSLVKENRYEDALKLAMDFYDERGKAVLGLRGTKDVRQKLVKEKVIETLENFVNIIIEGSDFLNYQEAIPMVVEHCLDDLLFDKLWNNMFDGKDYFLDSIELAIIQGKITDVPPEIMQKLVSYQQSINRWDELESCIQRVEVSCLDIEQVIVLCKRENLYNGLISVWNRALNDYTSPLHDLIPLLVSKIKDEGIVSKEARKLGNLLLVYIASCLSGTIVQDKNETARQQVVKALCSQHSYNATDDELSFPYIRALLEFDTREFLNSLVLSFSDASLSSQIKQRLVDIIIQVMTDGDSFLCTEISWVLCTLNSSALGRGLRVDPALYNEAIVRLISDESCAKTDRQQAFLQLVTSGCLVHLGFEKLLEQAEAAEFYNVCAVLNELKGEYGEVLKYNLLDPTRRQHIFSFIEQSNYKTEMGITKLENVQELVELDAHKSGQIFVRHFPETIPQILLTLSEENRYYFLKGMIEESDLDTEHMTQYFCLMCTFEPKNVLQVVKSNSNIEIDTAIQVSVEKGLDEVTAVLLERSGDLQGAFDVLLSRLQTAIKNNEENTELMTEELVSLAQRGNNVLDSKTSWLPLLTCLLELNCHKLLQRVLSNADLNLVSELHLLMQHTQGTLGELRSLIMGLFVKCQDQLRMLEATKRLHMSGLHGELSAVMNQAKIGCRAPRSCGICKSPFNDKFCLFRCGHGFHTDCIQQQREKCIKCYDD